MSRYTQLCRAFTESDAAYRDYERECMVVAEQFVQSLSAYLEAQDAYLVDCFDPQGQTRRYVQQMDVKEISKDPELWEFTDRTTFAPLTRVDDDPWGPRRFGVAIALEHAPGAYPKTRVPAMIELAKAGNALSLRVQSSPVRGISRSDPQSFHPACDDFIAIVTEALNRRPGSPQTVQRIGFL